MSKYKPPIPKAARANVAELQAHYGVTVTKTRSYRQKGWSRSISMLQARRNGRMVAAVKVQRDSRISADKLRAQVMLAGKREWKPLPKPVPKERRRRLWVHDLRMNGSTWTSTNGTLIHFDMHFQRWHTLEDAVEASAQGSSSWQAIKPKFDELCKKNQLDVQEGSVEIGIESSEQSDEQGQQLFFDGYVFTIYYPRRKSPWVEQGAVEHEA